MFLLYDELLVYIYYTGVSREKINILKGDSIGHFKQECLYERVFSIPNGKLLYAMFSQELINALMLTVKFLKFYYKL